MSGKLKEKVRLYTTYIVHTFNKLIKSLAFYWRLSHENICPCHVKNVKAKKSVRTKNK